MFRLTRTVMDHEAILDEFTGILVNDSKSLCSEGDQVASKIVEGNFETVKVIDMGTSTEVGGASGEVGEWELQDVVTRLPDGRVFRWRYAASRNEFAEDIGPGKYGKPSFQELVRVRNPFFRKQARRNLFYKGSLN